MNVSIAIYVDSAFLSRNQSSNGGTCIPSLLVKLTCSAGFRHKMLHLLSLNQSSFSSLSSMSKAHNILAKITRISSNAKLSSCQSQTYISMLCVKKNIELTSDQDTHACRQKTVDWLPSCRCNLCPANVPAENRKGD